MQSKVCQNIMESEYKTSFGGFIFYFTSEFYKNKFENEVENYIESEEIKIRNKYKVDLSLSLYLAISLYKKIEKRGFRVFDNIRKVPITPFTSFSISLLL